MECRRFKTVLQYSLVGSRFVLQYKLYCEVQEQEAGLPVSQGRQLCRDTALGRGVGSVGRAGRRWGMGAGAPGARARADARGAAEVRQGREGLATSRGARGARHGRCALGQARPRRAAGQRAVHSACFWLGLTQYCS